MYDVLLKLNRGVDVPIEPHEALLAGGWEDVGGNMVADDTAVRIRSLVDSELEKVASANGGWEILYRDRRDGRFWELFHPQGEMHGGGPESLRCIEIEEAAHKYFAGMTVNERLYCAGLMQEWDIAVQSRNRARMVEILSGVGLGSQADHIAGTELSDPKRYGF